MTVEEEYTHVSNILQSILLIFLGFLLFVFFFILLPYYPLADTYKILRNTDSLSQKVNKSSDSIKVSLNSYLDKHPDYDTHNLNITNNVNNYSSALFNKSKVYDKTIFSSGNDVTRNKIKGKINNIKTYDNCYGKINLVDWTACNGQAYQIDLKNRTYILIDNMTTNAINRSILDIEGYINNIQYNNNKSNIIDYKELITAHEIIKSLNKSLTEHKSLNKTATNVTYNTIDELDNLGKILIPSLAPTLGTYKNDIKKAISDFNEEIQSLSFPLVGDVPFTLSQVYLAFPTVIVLAFPFIVLQFRKLMILHDKPEKDKTSFTWMDPLQNGFGRFYPLLTLLLPLVLFSAFLVILHSSWYTNIDYREAYSLLTDPSVLIPQNRDLIIGLSYFFFILFLLSYFPIIKYAIKKK